MTACLQVISGYPPRNIRVYHRDVPRRLWPLFSRKEPVYRSTLDTEVEWEYLGRRVRVVIRAGFHYDGASIPWPARIVGLSRHSKHPHLDWMALPHDGGYRGAARFDWLPEGRQQRLAFDCLMRDMALWAADKELTGMLGVADKLAASPLAKPSQIGQSRRRAHREYRRMRRQAQACYRGVRIGGWACWGPRSDLQDGTMMTIEEVVSSE